MPELLLALLILWGVLYGVRLFARANPAVVAKVVKRGGGTLSLVAAGLLLLRGRSRYSRSASAVSASGCSAGRRARVSMVFAGQGAGSGGAACRACARP